MQIHLNFGIKYGLKKNFQKKFDKIGVFNYSLTMEKSAVEWLGKQLTMLDRKSPMYEVIRDGLIEQAKQMESDNLERLKNFDTWKEWKNK